MDKKVTLKSLDRITNRVLEDCTKEELTQILLAEILKDIVNEMPDNHSFIEACAKSRASADAAMEQAIAYARGAMSPQEPTIMEQFCKWKEFDRRPRKFICRAIFEKTFSNLSFAQALEAAAKGKRVTHETWSKRSYITQVGDHFVRASIDSDNVDDRIGITTEMLTGWIVLDK